MKLDLNVIIVMYIYAYLVTGIVSNCIILKKDIRKVPTLVTLNNNCIGARLSEPSHHASFV